MFTRRAKLEGSWFNGREPDVDRRKGSYGYLASPEADQPDVSVQRVTASAVHATPLAHGES